ncbi:MAG: hypothetical protein KIT72_11670 [Polyangiaceae bacterium]|nr:hypothetical protein [Polyangiaceae bacterium]MCW5791071.1 hypothetical protein [Polyangiaceae bacterium]
MFGRGMGWLAVGALVLGVSCSRSSLEFEPPASGGNGGVGGSAASGGFGGSVAGAAGVAGIGGMAGGGTGGIEVCRVDTECADGDPCTTDRCVGGVCQHSLRDDDGDGYPAASCGGTDCNDLNPNTNPGQLENCFDGDDNDCNGVTDCFDPACFGVPSCGCVPNPAGEICDNGVDDDCDGRVDCFDASCAGTPACGCATSEVGLCGNGFDDDCDGRIDCDDFDCMGTDECICRNQRERCDDGIDNDCDGLIDCADSECVGTAACTCVPPGRPEICNDGVDNDCDGRVDCADLDCVASPACSQCRPEVCDDGVDNDCDGRIDCADDSCFFHPSCAPTAEICNNGLDDDNDNLIDCDDPDCASNPTCVIKQSNCLSPRFIPGTGQYPGDTTGNLGRTRGTCGGDAGEAVFYFVLDTASRVHLDTIGTSFDSVLYVRQGSCNGGREFGCDDDSGGVAWAARLDFHILYPGTYYVFVDGYTVDPVGGPNEGPFVLNVEIEPNPPEICNDGIDNDGDRYVDCADPDCVNAPHCFNCNSGRPPTAEFGVDACTDGLDNDCDGVADCADPDCSASDYYVTECCDGRDENGNGIPDDFNCGCASNADCPFDQICYTHTSWACGFPCTSYFGDICPFVAPGSACNSVTLQCEFIQ